MWANPFVDFICGVGNTELKLAVRAHSEILEVGKMIATLSCS